MHTCTECDYETERLGKLKRHLKTHLRTKKDFKGVERESSDLFDLRDQVLTDSSGDESLEYSSSDMESTRPPKKKFKTKQKQIDRDYKTDYPSIPMTNTVL